MLTTDHSHNTTNNAGFPPAPPEAHQEADAKSEHVVDDELEFYIAVLEYGWVSEPKH